MQLPSGEVIDGVVPAGLSDDEVKSYVRMKRPDLFGAPAGVPRPSLYAPANAPQSQVPWQQSRLGKQDNSDPDLARMNRNIYAADAASNPTPTDALAAGGTLAAGAGLARSLPFLANVARQHPTITALAAQEAIHQARQIPGVGRFIPGAAEWLPFLLGGKGKVAAETEAPIPEPSAPRAQAPAPQVEATATTTQLPWVPPKVKMQFAPKEGPLAGSPEDIAETNQIQDQVRSQAEGESEALRRQGEAEGWARNTRTRTPKGVLTGTANQPVKYTKTPGVRSPGTAAPQAPDSASDDLTEQWQRNLDYIKGKKKQQ